MRLAFGNATAWLDGGGNGFLGGFLVLAGLGFGLLDLCLSDTLVELVDAAGGVEEFLLSRVEGMAARAHFDADIVQG